MNKKKVLLSLAPILGGTALSAGVAVGLMNSANETVSEQSSSNQSTSSNSTSFKISSQSGDMTVEYGLNAYLSAIIQKNSTSDFLDLVWKVDKGDGKGYTVIQRGKTPTDELICSTVLTATPPTNVTTAVTYKYMLTVTNINNPSETLNSKEINVTFLPQTSIYINVSKQPESKSVKSGDSVSLNVQANIHSGSTGTLGYQWFVDKDNSGVFTKIDGATNNTYTFVAENNTSSNITSRYICKFYVNNSDTYIYVSNVAFVTISPSDSDITKSNITIASQTQSSGTVILGSKTTIAFNVEATSKSGEQLYYDWYLQKKGSTSTLKQSGTVGLFRLNGEDFPSGNAGEEWTAYAIIHNRDKTDSIKSKVFDFTLTESKIDTNSSIQITNISKDVVAKTGQKTTLHVTASSNDPSTLKYQWYVEENGEWSLISEATSSSYEIPSVKSGKSLYMVQISSSSVTLQSDNIEVTGN